MGNDLANGQLDLLLLAVLRRTPAHGYAIVQVLRQRSGGTLDFAEGTIYPALHRLEQSGSVTSSWVRDGGRRRKVYRLSPSGEVEFNRRRRSWQDFARNLEAVVGELW